LGFSTHPDHLSANNHYDNLIIMIKLEKNGENAFLLRVASVAKRKCDL